MSLNSEDAANAIFGEFQKGTNAIEDNENISDIK